MYARADMCVGCDPQHVYMLESRRVLVATPSTKGGESEPHLDLDLDALFNFIYLIFITISGIV